MPSARTTVQHMPPAVSRHHTIMLHVFGDHRCDRVEITCIEECVAVPQLRRTVSAGRGATPPATEQIDVALACEIETVTVRADERACRCGQVKPANRTSQ